MHSRIKSTFSLWTRSLCVEGWELSLKICRASRAALENCRAKSFGSRKIICCIFNTCLIIITSGGLLGGDARGRNENFCSVRLIVELCETFLGSSELKISLKTCMWGSGGGLRINPEWLLSCSTSSVVSPSPRQTFALRSKTLKLPKKY